MSPEPLLHVVLDRPRIPANVGAIARLCAATGCALHACGPFVFGDLSRAQTKIKRAGLDYWDAALVHFHGDLSRCLEVLGRAPFVVEVGEGSAVWDAPLSRGDVVVLGPEDDDVDESRLTERKGRITLPMTDAVRSINVSQCAAVVVFDAVRRLSEIR